MIGMTTKLAALELLRKRLLSSADANLPSLGHLIDTHPEFCRMGALGTALPEHDLNGGRGLGHQNWYFIHDDWTHPVSIEPSA
ncbi:hypothetical protein ACQUJS_10445 [Ralstonia pseudosolanacearum]|uniref:Hypothethical protein n=1 Tax=Ralstonia solanacearum TaxID=305 RepID=A0A0S4TLB5_RALSL|nr:hypothetical protein [Ralstonia pseudosolanacearum]OAI77597.1 hypothetical protein RSP799_17820 [Ralstonia solanacearum]QCX51205.1 hypothetical protein E7Z57_19110 [Ralstonia pseudosolanacearum]CUV10871.1 Hypothethical protein [Ralstonia solanacearum]